MGGSFKDGSMYARFRRVWDYLARKGICDAAKSAEYYRVRDEWVRRDFPWPIAPFIRREANRPGPARPDPTE